MVKIIQKNNSTKDSELVVFNRIDFEKMLRYTIEINFILKKSIKVISGEIIDNFSTVIETSEDQKIKCSVNDVVNIWNESSMVESRLMGKVVAITQKRRSSVHSCIKSILHTEKDWSDYFHKVSNLPFLLGSNDRNWKASFD